MVFDLLLFVMRPNKSFLQLLGTLAMIFIHKGIPKVCFFLWRDDILNGKDVLLWVWDMLGKMWIWVYWHFHTVLIPRFLHGTKLLPGRIPLFTTSFSPWTRRKGNVYWLCNHLARGTVLSDVYLWNMENGPRTIMTLNGGEALCLNV